MMAHKPVPVQDEEHAGGADRGRRAGRRLSGTPASLNVTQCSTATIFSETQNKIRTELLMRQEFPIHQPLQGAFFFTKKVTAMSHVRVVVAILLPPHRRAPGVCPPKSRLSNTRVYGRRPARLPRLRDRRPRRQGDTQGPWLQGPSRQADHTRDTAGAAAGHTSPPLPRAVRPPRSDPPGAAASCFLRGEARRPGGGGRSRAPGITLCRRAEGT